MPDTPPDCAASTALILAAMDAAGLADDLALAVAVTARLTPPLRLSQSTARRWIDGGGIPDAFQPALCAALPSLVHADLARALAEQAAAKRPTAILRGEW